MYGCASEMRDIRTIDWNEAWKEAKALRTSAKRDIKFWNRRAPSFAKHVTETVYPDAFLKILNPEPQWSVLDMACGGGTLAVPLAKRSRQVTAVDFSDKMLEIVKEKCKEEKVVNITTINARWEDDWNACGIGGYDVAIASRSLVVDDLRAAILKLDAAARERVYLSTIVGDGPYDRRVFEALGRPLNMGPDYIYNYNLLYQMGIHAEVTFIEEKNNRCFEDREDAMNSMRWMLDDLTPAEERTLRAYLDEHLARGDEGWRMDYDRSIRWAVMWWRKEGGSRA
jgi:SAM-dependent methyltransferase